jgi:hypothetical protein
MLLGKRASEKAQFSSSYFQTTNLALHQMSAIVFGYKTFSSLSFLRHAASYI